jgi:hypothetical protein
MSNVAIVFAVMGTFSQVAARNEAPSCYGCYRCMIVPRSLRANYDHSWLNDAGPNPRAGYCGNKALAAIRPQHTNLEYE